MHFLQGEPQEIAYRESLSEACVGTKGIGNKGFGREIREKAKGLFWA